MNGAPWVEARDSFAFFEDDVVAVLQSVLGMSEQAARNWFNGEETKELSIAQLVADIQKYVDSKGKQFRLLFMVDEVGQYIGDDGDLMINLQSLVEEIGTRCMGKVWVMVTSQEAIDSVVHITGDDFSKIQGRFNTRLSLSSSSVDEVIKKRVLAKTEEADHLLHTVYDKEHAVLKNLYTFNNQVLDIKDSPTGRSSRRPSPLSPISSSSSKMCSRRFESMATPASTCLGASGSMLLVSRRPPKKCKIRMKMHWSPSACSMTPYIPSWKAPFAG